jgi:ceramide glucosyltransferase
MDAASLWTFLAAAGAASGSAYGILAAVRLRRFFQQPPPPPDRPLPAVTVFRPMKPGVRDLPGKIARLRAALRPTDQILVGLDAGSAEAAADLHGAEIIRCAPPPPGFNPKVAKLRQMSPAARHPHWIVMDAEAEPDRAFLDRFRAEWLEADAITAGYRFSPATTFPEGLDHAPALLFLWPGLMFARRDFTLGACTGFRRDSLEAAGGWVPLERELAEDRRLGQRLAAGGARIALSRAVLELDSDRVGWRDGWAHQLRVAATYRAEAPVGWAASVTTHGWTAALALAAIAPGEPWRWGVLGAVTLVRYATARAFARATGQCPLSLPLLVAADLAGSLFWVLSWGVRRVRWAGQTYRLVGRQLRPDRKRPG